jgi:hypothetical protein
MLTEQETQRVETLFTHHAPTGDQPQQYESIRSAAKEFALVLLRNTPPSADQTAALRKLRECVMTANASIALNGQS